MYIVEILLCLLIGMYSYQYVMKYCQLVEEKNKYMYSIFLGSAIYIGLKLSQYKIESNYVSILVATVIGACIVLTVVDLICYEIPMMLNVIILLASLGVMLISQEKYYKNFIGMFITGGIFFLLHYFTGGAGMGFGDVKLMFFSSIGLGLERSLLTFFISFVSATLIHPICMKLLGKGNALAFGPYMALGIIISHLYGNEILEIYYRISFMEGF